MTAQIIAFPGVDEYALLLQCRRSGQVSDSQWDAHMRNEEFRRYVEVHGYGGNSSGKSESEAVALVNDAGAAVVAMNTGSGFHVAKFAFDHRSRQWRLVDSADSAHG